jgi:hypothetical protein
MTKNIDSICKIKPFEDWYEKRGKYLSIKYYLAYRIYQYERLDHYEIIEKRPSFFKVLIKKSVKTICKELQISKITFQRYSRILKKEDVYEILCPYCKKGKLEDSPPDFHFLECHICNNILEKIQK